MPIRPSAILTANIDERIDFDGSLTQALKRSYLYIAPTRVNYHQEAIDDKTQAAIDAAAKNEDGSIDARKQLAASLEAVPAHNVMRLAVRLHKPYWETDNPQAVELWDTMMDRWLKNITSKISNTMVAFNTMRRRNNGLEVRFESLQVEFENKALIELALSPDCSASDQAAHALKLARAWFNSGITAQSVALLRIDAQADDEYALDLSRAQARFTDGSSREVSLG